MLKWNDIIDTIREKKISVKVVTMAAALLVLTGLVGIRQSIPTSSTVGDRELPIYCVETQEPKIALTDVYKRQLCALIRSISSK